VKENSLSDILSHETANRILIIPFEDQSLPRKVKLERSAATIEVMGKSDFAGLSPSRLMTKLRKDRWDLVICSLSQSTVNRSRSSAELMLGLVRARARYLRMAESDFRRITVVYLTFVVFPRLLFGLVAGSVSVLGLYGLIVLTKMSSDGHRRQPPGSDRTILFLRTDLPGELKAGGSISHTKGMINAFLRSGYRVVYIADARISSLPANVEQIVVKPVGALDIFDEFQLAAYNFQLLIRSNRWMRQYKPTLVYQRHGILNFSGGLIARHATVPCVLEANASEVWVKGHWSRLVLKDLARRCESLALELADRVTVISEGVREQLEPYGLSDHKVVLNPNAVDPTEFHPAIDGSAVREKYGLGKKTVVGFIGTFTKWHGVETLFEAAVSVAQQNTDIVFLLIGDGELRSILEQRTRQSGLERSILFTGLIPHSAAPSYLAACDILVSPHLGFAGNEKFFGSPTKLFEYMAMGKAIIASKLEQIGEVIEDGKTGLHSLPGDAAGLADKILIVAGDVALRRTLSSNARSVVESRYTWERNVERIIESLRGQK
jgi:glycosyltransferase involved in cell wall biosynthesis